MANEIGLSLGLTCARDGATAQGVVSLSITQAGTEMTQNVQSIGTSTEALALGDVATPGYLFVKNLDSTNFVLVGLVTAVTSGNAFAKLLPGEGLVIPTRQTVVYAIADTGACNCLVVWAEL